MNKPLVTIVIPAYNASNYLAEAIDSALAQTYPSIEIIVVNDGSPDGGLTEQVALSFGDKIRYFHKPNGGVGSALNLAIREMRGSLFCWLSHDDLFDPDKTAEQVEAFLNAGHSKAIVFSDFRFIDRNRQVLSTVSLERIDTQQMHFHLLHESCFHGCTFMVPKEALDAVGHFDESLRFVQDYALWIALSQKFPFLRVPKVLVSGRLHEQQDSNVQKPQAHHEADRFFSRQIREFVVQDPKVSARKARQLLELQRSHQRAGRSGAARVSKQELFRLMFNPRSWGWMSERLFHRLFPL